MMEATGKCSVPMWDGFGFPAGVCGADAHGIYIDGPTFRDAYTGEVRRMDGKFRSHGAGLHCPRHGGPEPTGPRVFVDGATKEGRPMYCAVMHDFENLQESPAGFDGRPWVAIEKLHDAIRAAGTPAEQPHSASVPPLASGEGATYRNIKRNV